ncbi:hypothetical protein AN958_07920 [Leucoagaricus sp. SymC.cos]|nr:hypothetical protein AN958_07920 [Leucoagaricus sp. SymC.cos]
MGDPVQGVVAEDQKLRRKSKKGKEKEESPEGTVTKKERKDKKKKDEAVVNEIVKENGGDGKTRVVHEKEKRKKKVRDGTPHDDHMNSDRAAQAEERELKREKKKRKRDAQEEETKLDDNVQPRKKLKKTHVEQVLGEINPAKDQETSPDEKTKQKKKKGKNQKTSSKEPVAEDAAEQQRKKRENSTGFPDPEEAPDEEALTDQAKKALSYAFTQFHEPDLWKFNKAKQNWLVRNFWNMKMIPDKYGGLAIKYLSAVQGNTRENLISSCREVINDDQSPGETSAAQINTTLGLGGALIDTSALSTEGDMKKARARSLLQALIPEPET